MFHLVADNEKKTVAICTEGGEQMEFKSQEELDVFIAELRGLALLQGLTRLSFGVKDAVKEANHGA